MKSEINVRTMLFVEGNNKSTASGGDQVLFAPGAVIPEIRINRPAAFAAKFWKRPDIPRPFDFTMTPWAVTHKPDQFSAAFFTSCMVAHFE